MAPIASRMSRETKQKAAKCIPSRGSKSELFIWVVGLGEQRLAKHEAQPVTWVHVPEGSVRTYPLQSEQLLCFWGGPRVVRIGFGHDLPKLIYSFV